MQPLTLVNTAFPREPSSFGWPLTQYGTCAVATFPSVYVGLTKCWLWYLRVQLVGTNCFGLFFKTFTLL